MKKLYLSLITLLMLLALASAAHAEARLGEPFMDFTVTTLDGETFTLSEALKDYEAVYVNLFATWCPPCRQEFPDLESVYGKYAEKVATIAISIEPTDTPEKLRAFAEELGLTFPMAPAGDIDFTGYVADLASYAIPDSILIDRFGNLAFFMRGMIPDAARFERIFEATLGDGYTESRVWTDLPLPAMDVPVPDDADLSAALNAGGGAIAFTSSDQDGIYPFVIEQEGGRAAVYASNTDVADTIARFDAAFTAAEDGAFAFDVLYQGDAGSCALTVQLDGETVKTLRGGASDWLGWAVPIGAGDHELTVECATLNDGVGARVGVDEVRLLYGDEAQSALDALPDYPVSAENRIAEIDGARAMDVTAGDDALGMPLYLVPGGVARAVIEADAGVDPHGALVYLQGPVNTECWTLSEFYDALQGKYIAELPIPGDDDLGDHVYALDFLPDAGDEEYFVYLIGEEDYVSEITGQYSAAYPDYDWGWKYLEQGE